MLSNLNSNLSITLNMEICGLFQIWILWIIILITNTPQWDTAGQERYRSIITAYYRGAHGILLTFDLTRRESYDNIRRWLLDVNKHAHQHTKTVLVGNKKDVDHMRNVTREEAEELARELGIKYFEGKLFIFFS